MHGAVSRVEREEILIRSIASVAKPLLFSLLIILASFLPVFFLEQREARLFDPLAYSKTFAMAFSTLLTLIPAAVLLTRFPKDFLPNVDEGAILYMPTTLPGLPNREAGWVVQQMDKKLKAFPEVESVFGKIGRADTSTDPAPLTMIETTVLLKQIGRASCRERVYVLV